MYAHLHSALGWCLRKNHCIDEVNPEDRSVLGRFLITLAELNKFEKEIQADLNIGHLKPYPYYTNYAHVSFNPSQEMVSTQGGPKLVLS